MSPPIRSHDLRSENRRRVVEALRRLGSSSRGDLGEATGLSPAAISSFASDLVTEGVVQATRKAVGRGRPQSVLALAPDAATMITLSLSIDRLDLQLIDYAGTVLEQTEHDLDTRSLDEQGVIDTVVDAIAILAASPQAQRLRHVSVSFQGITAHSKGELVWSPILSVGNVPLGPAITERLGISASVDNDTRMIAGALHADSRDKLGSNFATVLFSHGVGLALTLNDKPFSGIATSALELGHLQHERNGRPCRCGQHGCIEAYAADYAILHAIEINRGKADTNADAHVSPGRLPVDRLVQEAEAAAAGDSSATASFQAAGSAIGCGLRDLFLLLGPMPVALVGRSPAVLDAMRPSLIAELEAAGPQAGGLGSVPLVTFPEDDALLRRGLVHNALTAVDAQLAEVQARVDADATATVNS